MQIVVFTLALAAFLVAQVGGIEVEWRDQELDSVPRRVQKFKCTEEGRFAHPNLCGGYVECIRDSKYGTFDRRFGNCHGAIFNSQQKACMVTSEEHCERSARSARAASTDRRLTGLCSEIRNGFVCADCKTAVNCVEGVAYTESCGDGHTCSNMDVFGGAVCYPQPSQNCTCLNANDFLGDAYSPEMFFFCSDFQAEPEMYQCPRDKQFDVEKRECKSQSDLPPCTAPGIFPYYEDCSRYYICIDTQNSWVQKPYSCENGTMYNEDSSSCEDPCFWDTGDFTCIEEGRFPDPLDCGGFYECIVQGNDFRKKHRKCPGDFQWDDSTKRCAKESATPCNPIKVSKCVIPEGMCTDGTVVEALTGAARNVGRSEVSVNSRIRPIPGGVRPLQYTLVNVPQRYEQIGAWQTLNRGERRARENPSLK